MIFWHKPRPLFLLSILIPGNPQGYHGQLIALCQGQAAPIWPKPV